MSHNKRPFWKFIMDIITSSNIDYSHKTFCIVCWQFKCGMFARKNVTNITIRDGIFHHTYHDWPSCKSNAEAMVINNMWYSLKYASIWMMILRNHFHKLPVAEMWLDNKKYDWKFFFFKLILLPDFQILLPDFKNIPQPLIWLSSEHHI